MQYTLLSWEQTTVIAQQNNGIDVTRLQPWHWRHRLDRATRVNTRGRNTSTYPCSVGPSLLYHQQETHFLSAAQSSTSALYRYINTSAIKFTQYPTCVLQFVQTFAGLKDSSLPKTRASTCSVWNRQTVQYYSQCGKNNLTPIPFALASTEYSKYIHIMEAHHINTQYFSHWCCRTKATTQPY